MATYNNQHWLLSHIRNAFISTDESGMCESIMMNEDLPKHFLQKCEQLDLTCYPGLDEQSDDEDLDLTAQSFDILFPEQSSYRFRSNTAQRLEKMDIARKKASRMKSIKVTEPNNDTDYSDFFIAKTELSPAPDESKSLLSDQLIKIPIQPKNKFAQYAKFDGTSHTGEVTRTFRVFINMLPENKRSYPLQLCVVADTKILDIIGFICYKSLIHNPSLVLGDVRNYGLYIAEDNGEMEALPPLDVRESFGKFKFSYFTLVERRSNSTTTSRNDFRTVSIVFDLEAELASGTDNSARKQQTFNKNEIEIQKMFDRIEAPIYRTYRVYCKNFFFRNEVQLGVSGERIEIDPVPQKNSKLWKKQKAVTYNIDHIAFIEMHEQRSSKSVVRMWYGYSPQQVQLTPNETTATMSVSPQHLTSYFNNFKYYDFETDKKTAQQILSKINCLLEIRSSCIHKEFLSERDKKKEKK